MAKVRSGNASSDLNLVPVTQDVAGSSPVRPATSHKWSPLEPEGFPSLEPEGFFVSSNENFQLRSSKVRRKTAKVGHVQVGFLGVPEAARLLKASQKSVTRWCESGKLPAIATPYEDATNSKERNENRHSTEARNR